MEGTQLVDASGKAVQLRGVSTHGMTWFPDFIDESLFSQVSEDWNCDLIRLPMYTFTYAGKEKEENYALMKKGIEAGIAADTYVLVDWHVLEKGDPNEEVDAALEFFERITEEYAGCPNLIFEICNEPNGEADWSDVLRYANKVIPVIRANIPEAVILVGTPEYDRNLGGAVLRPLDFDNVMYVLHFYAASHGEGLRGELQAALEAGLPVFISECGICESSGDGRIDFASAAEWFRYLNENKISYTIWSLSNKDESSAFFTPRYEPADPIRDQDLTPCGLWVRELIRGKDPDQIAVSSAIVEKDRLTRIKNWLFNSLGERGVRAVRSWPLFARISAGIMFLTMLLNILFVRSGRGQRFSYDDVVFSDEKKPGRSAKDIFARTCLLLSAFCTLNYLCWRIVYSIPKQFGPVAVGGNLLLLIVEILGFVESLILYQSLLMNRAHPLPKIPDDAWPEVDIFIATYNEPTELLQKTVNGCKHLKYPDKSRVHIWICDDNRRPEMRALAEKMGVGYFDRPDNKGSKAGNLNHALGLTSAPYIVTLDADMIPKSDFLLKTIPYFVDVEIREAQKPEAERKHLGLLQTPQSFYDPDVFQHALYSEKRAPNEQDFFYRTIEPAKTSANSVIYGGSNTVLSRRALEDIGGFYTESITEDFATGLMIESAGYVSLALPEPLASGQTPHTFREHIQQRTRWGRGVIVTAKKLKIWSRKNLTLTQKISYWSSVVYWYSPVKNLIYMLSPLLFAVFAVPVFLCNWLELLVFWIPMFILQDLTLKLNSKGAISTKWSGIYETSVMPHLLIPIIQESLGISLSTFKVTDKSRQSGKRERDQRAMIPFLVLAGLSVAGIVRIILIFDAMQTFSLVILLYWIIRNLYFLIMALFLVDGRDGSGEVVLVRDAEIVTVESCGVLYEGVTTLLTEHNLTVFLDEGKSLGLGMPAAVTIYGSEWTVHVKGVITGILEGRSGNYRTHTIEILDFGGAELEYLQLLYDRVPTLPQTLQKDFGLLIHLWQNIAHRVARTRK
ncbi:MAG: cellulase family glycosylhydrolase [Eubacteriales bacterium]|nr:cellulase family glycosylhydrolase [Eubacteriales bacterium]